MNHSNTYQPTQCFSAALTLAPISIGLLLFGCGKKPEAETIPIARPIKMLELRDENMPIFFEFPGETQPFSQAVLAFEVSGFMQERFVGEGQQVEKGHLLAKLDDRDYQANKNSAQAQFNAAKIEEERARALYERQATSKQRLDTATSNLEVATAALQRATKALEDTELRAPMSGVIAKILVEDIVTIAAGTPILIMQDLSKMKIVVDVPESKGVLGSTDRSFEEVTKLAKPEVTLSALPDRSFPAQITEASSTVDPLTRTYEVTAGFDKPSDIRILPGMTANVRLEFIINPSLNAPKGFPVPLSAVAGDSSKNAYVWKVDTDKGTVNRVPVNTGGTLSAELIEIMSEELKSGDRIAISGVHHLEENSLVSEL